MGFTVASFLTLLFGIPLIQQSAYSDNLLIPERSVALPREEGSLRSNVSHDGKEKVGRDATHGDGYRRRQNIKSIVTTDERQIRFYLYTDNHLPGQRIIIGNVDSVRSAGMQPEKPLKILMHGFQQTYLSDFPQKHEERFTCAKLKTLFDATCSCDRVWDLISAYLSNGEEEYNVICVDWGPLARGSGPLASIFYPLVVENVPKVGEKVADLISFLRSHGFVNSFEFVHLIGFSLGAHAAGITGSLIQRRLFRKIGRITGLDPAGPKYATTEPFSRRLDPTDAKFVDVVHTNSLKLGYAGQLGHVDFYPNGGRDQPNCDQRPGTVTKNRPPGYSIQHLFTASCSHSRAPMYFTKSIKSMEIACRCTSWFEFRRSCKFKCRDPVIFGEHVPNTARGKYFLDATL